MASNPYAEHITTGHSLLRRLATVERNLLDMAERWGDLDTWIMTTLQQQADQVKSFREELVGVMDEWKRGAEWEDV